MRLTIIFDFVKKNPSGDLETGVQPVGERGGGGVGVCRAGERREGHGAPGHVLGRLDQVMG